MAISTTWRRFASSVALGVATLAAPSSALAETLNGALSKAYTNNPSLNAVRAVQRRTDELVAVAKSGNRPTVTGQVDYSITSREDPFTGDFSTGGPTTRFQINAQQNVFSGYQVRNRIRGAKADVFAGQEQLRATEQEILLAAVAAYVNVRRDIRVVGFRQRNIAFLNEQLNAAQARFEVGEGTRTDVAQARAERAAAIAELEAARANLRTSEATYVQIVGSAPSNLRAASPASALLPHGLEQALAIAEKTHPDIRTAQFTVESSAFGVKEQEGSFLPGVSVNASAVATRGPQERAADLGFQRSYTVGASVSVPLYRGGAGAANVRIAKEALSEARIRVDEARRAVRAGVVDAFSSYRSALANRDSTRVQIDAARLALEGLIEERNVGQRTTLDVLLGQQTLINAQLVAAQNDALLVISSYQLVAAVGKLTARRLGLHVQLHDPDAHYVAVKDKWYGLRTPDQR